jgi:hypothetical protein
MVSTITSAVCEYSITAGLYRYIFTHRILIAKKILRNQLTTNQVVEQKNEVCSSDLCRWVGALTTVSSRSTTTTLFAESDTTRS